jgi:hypothetical protein
MKTTAEAIRYLLDAKSSDEPLRSIGNFIDGKFVDAERQMESEEPATGEIWLKIPRSGQADVDKAVEAAYKAFNRLNFEFSNCTNDLIAFWMHPYVVVS